MLALGIIKLVMEILLSTLEACSRYVKIDMESWVT